VLAKRAIRSHAFAMSSKILLPCFAVLLWSASMIQAQNPTQPQNTEDSPRANRFWQATLPGGHYMVALDRISSVSRHRYLLDGALIVDEVTIDSLGQALARFYHISPVTDATAASCWIRQPTSQAPEFTKWWSKNFPKPPTPRPSNTDCYPLRNWPDCMTACAPHGRAGAAGNSR